MLIPGFVGGRGGMIFLGLVTGSSIELLGGILAKLLVGLVIGRGGMLCSG